MSTVASERPDEFVEPPASGETNRWIVLVIVCLAQFMVVLDATVVNVALMLAVRKRDVANVDPDAVPVPGA